MYYQVLSPYVVTIQGDSYKEAIKNFAKINYNVAINSMIIQDQQKYYQAQFKYYKKNNKNKVGITVNPYIYPNSLPIVGSPLTPIYPNSLPIVGSPLTIPTVITYS